MNGKKNTVIIADIPKEIIMIFQRIYSIQMDAICILLRDVWHFMIKGIWAKECSRAIIHMLDASA